jgi:hypothetical protein
MPPLRRLGAFARVRIRKSGKPTDLENDVIIDAVLGI